MSEKELSLTRKLFAVVERLVRENKVHDLDLNIEISKDGVLALNPGISAGVGDMQFEIPSGSVDMPLEIPVETVEVLQELIETPVHDASPESLHTDVMDEDMEAFQDVRVHDYDSDAPIDTGFKVNDFFRQFDLKSKPLYTTEVRDVNILKLSTGIKDFPLQHNVQVRENLTFFRKLTVEHASAELSYLPEKEQLIFWKRAVQKTGKEPRHLKIIGVYTGIPYQCIQTEKITVNPSRKTLIYHYKSKFPWNYSKEPLEALALFTTYTDDAGGSNAGKSLIMVKK